MNDGPVPSGREREGTRGGNALTQVRRSAPERISIRQRAQKDAPRLFSTENSGFPLGISIVGMVERREPAGIPPSPSATAHPGPGPGPVEPFPGVYGSGSERFPESRKSDSSGGGPEFHVPAFVFDSPGKLERGIFRGRARQAAPSRRSGSTFSGLG